jgi:hypothetical protein
MDMCLQQRNYGPCFGNQGPVISSLIQERRSATIFALEKWRNAWVSSRKQTPPAHTVGMSSEQGMMRWVLFKLFYEKNALGFLDGSMSQWTDSERLANILRLIKAIQMTVERRGVHEEDLTPEIIEDTLLSASLIPEGDELQASKFGFIVGWKAKG